MGLIAHYLRVFFRSHTRPINPSVAKKGEVTSSIIYLLSSTASLFGLIYIYFKNAEKNKEGPYSDGLAFTAYDSVRKFGLENKPATIITFKGLSMSTEVVDRDDKKLIPTKIL